MRKVFIGAAGLAAFVFACILVGVVQTVVGSMIRSNEPDKPGKLELDPQLKSKQEWEAKHPKPTEAKAEEPKVEEKQPAPVENDAPLAASQPESYRTPAPAPINSLGPGNFDMPQYYAPTPGPTGPGNL